MDICLCVHASVCLCVCGHLCVCTSVCVSLLFLMLMCTIFILTITVQFGMDTLHDDMESMVLFKFNVIMQSRYCVKLFCQLKKLVNADNLTRHILQ